LPTAWMKPLACGTSHGRGPNPSRGGRRSSAPTARSCRQGQPCEDPAGGW
jgi:hypothetical protein